MVLRAPANGAPRQGTLFLIVDEHLVVQAVSRAAEAVLLVDEPDGIDTPLAEFLLPADGDSRSTEVARLVALATSRTPSPAVIELRTAGHPALWFAARVSSCSPPPAALLLLTPIAARSAPSVNGGPIGGRNGRPDNLRNGHGAT